MKKTIVFLLAIALALSALCLTACGKDDTHTHEWGAWQSNAEQHWKECSCGEKTDIGNHTGNPCTVCGYEEIPTVPQPKIIDNTNGLAFDGKVTIKTSDLYTAVEWDATVASVVAALNAAYTGATGAGKNRFGRVFDNNNNAEIVLVNNLANNWEVRDGEFNTLYLKTGSIATADYGSAIAIMDPNGNPSPGTGKATPPKHRVFLATVSDTKIEQNYRLL
jgi:hypothetical protein